MALTLGHAIRRRMGIAPNPQVMAESGQPEGRPTTTECSVVGCTDRLPLPVGPTPSEVTRQRDDYYQHALVKHPRHTNASSAREYFKSRMGF